MSNLIKYENELDLLIKFGKDLLIIMCLECDPKRKSICKKNRELEKLCKKTGDFRDNYQNWYSESLMVIKQLLPERLNDFIKLYEKPKGRKKIDCENYVIEDYLCGLMVRSVVEPSAAISRFKQQLHILESLKKRFQSSLFDLKTVLYADVFDSELEAAAELNEKGFTRGAGAMAGVVLEHHLSQVCDKRSIRIGKDHPTINDYNEILKQNNVIEIHIWRYIQRLGDLRNLCDHKKLKDPTKSEIEELILGVDKVCKTIF